MMRKITHLWHTESFKKDKKKSYLWSYYKAYSLIMLLMVYAMNEITDSLNGSTVCEVLLPLTTQ